MVHQSVYELVHSEDREELQRQLTWSSQLPTDSGLTLLDALRPDNSMILERSFTVRFRCLLDNTSGFLVKQKFDNKHLKKMTFNKTIAKKKKTIEFFRSVSRGAVGMLPSSRHSRET